MVQVRTIIVDGGAILILFQTMVAERVLQAEHLSGQGHPTTTELTIPLATSTPDRAVRLAIPGWAALAEVVARAASVVATQPETRAAGIKFRTPKNFVA